MVWLIALFIILWVLVYHNTPLPWATLAMGIFLATYTLQADAGNFHTLLWIIFAMLLIPLNFPIVRRQLFSRAVFNLMKKAIPSMSQTVS